MRTNAGPIKREVQSGHSAASVETKPSWRGWIHLASTPFVIAAGIVLICVAPTATGKISSAVFAASGVMLFGTSALYHRGNWAPKTKAILRRLDHSNIMIVIAGTYTPLSALLLTRSSATLILTIIWVGAAAGVLFRVFFTQAPRWLYVPIYVALGLSAVFFIPQFFAASIPAGILICVGGAFYVAGAVFYGLKRPNFSLRHFGFHEFFHAFTVAGFVCHFIAAMFAVFTATH